MEKRLIETRFTDEDAKVETSLRPKRLKEYIGQTRIKESMMISIEAAKQRGEPLDHILFSSGPHPFLRPSGIRQDHAGEYHRQ